MSKTKQLTALGNGANVRFQIKQGGNLIRMLNWETNAFRLLMSFELMLKNLGSNKKN